MSKTRSEHSNVKVSRIEPDSTSSKTHHTSHTRAFQSWTPMLQLQPWQVYVLSNSGRHTGIFFAAIVAIFCKHRRLDGCSCLSIQGQPHGGVHPGRRIPKMVCSLDVAGLRSWWRPCSWDAALCHAWLLKLHRTDDISVCHSACGLHPIKYVYRESCWTKRRANKYGTPTLTNEAQNLESTQE